MYILFEEHQYENSLVEKVLFSILEQRYDRVVSYHGMMISLPEIFVAKRLIFIEKNVKNAIKTISGGLLYENLVVQSY